jgi:HEAT repeat protein
MKTISGVVLGAVLAMGGSAWAGQGAILSSQALPATVRASLGEQVKAAHLSSPKSFEALGAVRSRAAAIDAQKRGRFGTVTPMLRALGAPVLLPMLEALAFEGTRGDLNDSAWQMWRVGLLEAVGSLKDLRAEPVLVTFLESTTTSRDPQVVRAAAEALGLLGTDLAVQTLTRLARQSSPVQLPILSALGSLRRVESAQVLADALRAESSPTVSRTLVGSLERVGSAWAWKTLDAQARREEAQVRQLSAEALVSAFARATDDNRTAISDALMVVDAPSTPQLLESAMRDAPESLVAQLRGVRERFDRNPIR